MKVPKSNLTHIEKEFFMREALVEANKALTIKEVPIGAVVVLDGQIIGRGYNLREHTQDATTHAEMLAIRQACKNISSWRLEKAQLFVTLEPCAMCSGAILLSRVAEVYFGAMDPKAGTVGTLMNLLMDQRQNHQAYFETGILADECGKILTDFFKKLRIDKKLVKEMKKY